MTSYSYKLVLNDSECIMMKEALEMMISHCEKMLKEEPCAPYYSWLASAKAVKSRMYENTQLTSFQSYDRNPPENP
jgi:hypothetical protein